MHSLEQACLGMYCVLSGLPGCAVCQVLCCGPHAQPQRLGSGVTLCCLGHGGLPVDRTEVTREARASKGVSTSRCEGHWPMDFAHILTEDCFVHFPCSDFGGPVHVLKTELGEMSLVLKSNMGATPGPSTPCAPVLTTGNGSFLSVPS